MVQYDVSQCSAVRRPRMHHAVSCHVRGEVSDEQRCCCFGERAEATHRAADPMRHGTVFGGGLREPAEPRDRSQCFCRCVVCRHADENDGAHAIRMRRGGGGGDERASGMPDEDTTGSNEGCNMSDMTGDVVRRIARLRGATESKEIRHDGPEGSVDRCDGVPISRRRPQSMEQDYWSTGTRSPDEEWARTFRVGL